MGIKHIGGNALPKPDQTWLVNVDDQAKQAPNPTNLVGFLLDQFSRALIPLSQDKNSKETPCA